MSESLRHLGIWLDAVKGVLGAARGTSEERQAALSYFEERLDEAAQIVLTAEESPQVAELQTAFGLSRFETLTLIFAAGWELDRAAFHQFLDPEVGPTLEMALAVLPEAHWSMCTPDAPLRRFRLIRFQGRGSLLTQPVRLEEGVLHFLKGVHVLSDEVRDSSIAPLEPPSAIAGCFDLDTTAFSKAGGKVCWVGDPWQARVKALALARSLGLPLREFTASGLPQQAKERNELAAAISRDVRLGALLPLLVVPPLMEPNELRAVDDLLKRVDAPVIVTTPDQIPFLDGFVQEELERPSHGQRKAAWEAALEGRFQGEPTELDALAHQFDLEPNELEQVVNSAPEFTTEALTRACIEVLTPSLQGLAQRLTHPVDLDDLVLSPLQREVLEGIEVAFRNRFVVDVEWGMQPSGARASMTALFSGPSGTGKTSAAMALAHRLGLPMFRVDLSSVVSKWVGETEKHLRKIFDEAERGTAVLIFDEADSLFGSRSSTQSAQDRYANMEVSYLLQRLETYSGLAILTTNHRDDLDAAFVRRIRTFLHFPAPTMAQREEIWDHMFDEQHRDELDLEWLAEAELTGGRIRNAALVAASFAADEKRPVNTGDAVRAAKLELAKERKPLPSSRWRAKR